MDSNFACASTFESFMGNFQSLFFRVCHSHTAQRLMISFAVTSITNSQSLSFNLVKTIINFYVIRNQFYQKSIEIIVVI